jgi:hypothetical protein
MLRCFWKYKLKDPKGKEEEDVFWWRNLRVRDCLEDPGVDGRIILR